MFPLYIYARFSMAFSAKWVLLSILIVLLAVITYYVVKYRKIMKYNIDVLLGKRDIERDEFGNVKVEDLENRLTKLTTFDEVAASGMFNGKKSSKRERVKSIIERSRGREMLRSFTDSSSK